MTSLGGFQLWYHSISLTFHKGGAGYRLKYLQTWSGLRFDSFTKANCLYLNVQESAESAHIVDKIIKDMVRHEQLFDPILQY